MFDHALASVGLLNISFDRHQNRVVFCLDDDLSLRLGFLLLLLGGLNLGNFSLQLVVDCEGVLEGLESVFVLNDHLFEFGDFICAQLLLVFLLR